jgi:hypothetical protein
VRLAVYSMSRLVTVAYLVLTVFFAWSVINEDGIPRAIWIASLPAAVITIIDASSRLVGRRQDGDASGANDT